MPTASGHVTMPVGVRAIPPGNGVSTVKGTGLVPARPATVTVTGPVAAPDGTRTVSALVVAVRTLAATPLVKRTWLPPGVVAKWAPWIVTSVPTGPRSATSPLIAGGARSMVKLAAAGVGSSFPARSRAFTSKVWEPSVRPVSVTVVAAAKADQAPPSSRQAKTRSAVAVSASVPVKPNVAGGAGSGRLVWLVIAGAARG